MIWAWLTSKLAGPIAVGAALVLGLTLTYVWVADAARIHVIQTALDQATADLGTSRENISKLQGGLGECNAGIERLKDAGLEATARANAALAEAERISGNLRTSAADVLKAKPSGDLCTSADALILGHLK
jgi:hypothetical protein